MTVDQQANTDSGRHWPVTDTVRQQFGPVANAYATFSFHAAGPDLQVITEAARLTGVERVVDLGCGAGHTAMAVAPHASRVTAVDVTPEMLDVAADLAARRGLTNIDFERHDATKLPYPDARFDVATSRVAAHHYHDPQPFVAEAARVLKPGGRLLLSDTVAPKDAALDTFCNAFELLRDPSHVRNWRVSEWSALMREHGLEPEVLYQFDLELEMHAWFERQQTPAERRAAVEALFAAATPAARERFHLDAKPGWFTLPIAVIRGVKTSSS